MRTMSKPKFKEATVRFFGDSELSACEPLIYFPNVKVACDYSECGLYIASKHFNVDKPMYTTLPRLISLLSTIYDEVKVEAWNNGIARFFEKNNIKTVKDLCSYFSRVLECPYP